jgi:hypothetical protein
VLLVMGSGPVNQVIPLAQHGRRHQIT